MTRPAVIPADIPVNSHWLFDMGMTVADIRLTLAFEQALAADVIVKKWKRKRADFSKGKVNK